MIVVVLFVLIKLCVIIIVFKFDLYILLIVVIFVFSGSFVFSDVCCVGDWLRLVGNIYFMMILLIIEIFIFL